MKTAKKLLLLTLILLVALFAFVACDEGGTCAHRDINDDGLCDKCEESYTDGKDIICQHRDINDDLLCDKCGEAYSDGKDVICQHRDADDNSLCDKCGESYTDGKDIEEEPTHNYSADWMYDENNHWHRCIESHCSATSDTAPHNFGDWIVTVTATCQKEGSRYHICQTCNYQEIETIPVNTDAHNFSTSWTTNGTQHWHKCTNTGCTAKGSAANHSFTAWTVTSAATCETDGTRTRTCTTCHYKASEVIPETGHSYATVWTTDGTSHWYPCTNTGCTGKGNANPHSFGNWTVTTAATCETDGTRTRTCTTCHYKASEVIPKTGHSYATVWTTDGTSHWYPCTNTGCTDKSDYAAHSFGDWTVAANSTCYQAGSQYRTCSTCNYRAEEALPLTEHDYSWSAYDNSHMRSCRNEGCNEKTQAAHEWNSSGICTTCALDKGLIFYKHSSGYKIDNYTGSAASVTIPAAYNGLPVTIIGLEAFYECTSLTSIAIPDSVTSIGPSAFSGCTSLTSVTIPDSVTSIDSYAFSGCKSLTSVTIGDSVTYISNFAFYYCTSLSSITIPDSVTSIGWYAFYGCAGVQVVNGVSYVDKWAFYCDISVTSVSLRQNTVGIGDYAFRNCTSLSSITIPDSVTSVGNSAFSGCTSLSSITIPDSVTSIGNGAFYKCTSLSSITIPDSVTSIGVEAFSDCTSLKSITIPNSVTSIGWYAFSDCTSLKSIIIPDSVTSIDDWAFSYCTSLTGVSIGDSVTSIGEAAFEGCTSLTGVSIGDSVTSIGEAAFSGCTSLTSVTIPDSVTIIANSAFHYCKSLTAIIFKGTVAEWKAISKGSDWNRYVPASKVVCSDGEVNI